jgi:hypothetical protein
VSSVHESCVPICLVSGFPTWRGSPGPRNRDWGGAMISMGCLHTKSLKACKSYTLRGKVKSVLKGIDYFFQIRDYRKWGGRAPSSPHDATTHVSISFFSSF